MVKPAKAARAEASRDPDLPACRLTAGLDLLASAGYGVPDRFRGMPTRATLTQALHTGQVPSPSTTLQARLPRGRAPAFQDRSVLLRGGGVPLSPGQASCEGTPGPRNRTQHQSPNRASTPGPKTPRCTSMLARGQGKHTGHPQSVWSWSCTMTEG